MKAFFDLMVCGRSHNIRFLIYDSYRYGLFFTGINYFCLNSETSVCKLLKLWLVLLLWCVRSQNICNLFVSHFYYDFCQHLKRTLIKLK